jgi:hypothetical protein
METVLHLLWLLNIPARGRKGRGGIPLRPFHKALEQTFNITDVIQANILG